MWFDHDDNVVSAHLYNKALQDLLQTQEQVCVLSERIRRLTIESLELKAQIDVEVACRNDMEKDVKSLINSPGAVKDQMQMWS